MIQTDDNYYGMFPSMIVEKFIMRHSTDFMNHAAMLVFREIKRT